jgi:polyisoprenoid-binding protein YceI
MTMRILAWLACAACACGAEVLTFDIRPAAGTHFALRVEKTGLLSGKKHQFVFERYRGTLSYDPESPERSRIEFAIESASAVCKDTWLSQKDLRKVQDYALNDMLAVERFRELTFSSSAVTRKGESTFEVQGALSIRGIAHTSVVTVRVEKQDPANLVLSGDAIVRLKDYGLKPPSAALGAIGTKNEMTVEFRLLAHPRTGGSGAGQDSVY